MKSHPKPDIINILSRLRLELNTSERMKSFVSNIEEDPFYLKTVVAEVFDPRRKESKELENAKSTLFYLSLSIPSLKKELDKFAGEYYRGLLNKYNDNQTPSTEHKPDKAAGKYYRDVLRKQGLLESESDISSGPSSSESEKDKPRHGKR